MSVLSQFTSLRRALLGAFICGGLLLPFCGVAGNIETLTHERYEGEVRVEGDGALTVTTTNGVQRFPLNQVRLARVNEPLFGPGNAPKGWRFEEIGDSHGTAYETNGLLTLRVTAGKGRDPKYQIGYFAHRILRCDGEVIARVQSVDGATENRNRVGSGIVTNRCLAGVMWRDTLDPYSPVATLGVTPDHHLRFESREGGWQSLTNRDGGRVELPIWLKLVHGRKEGEKEPMVRGYSSQDGKEWRLIGQTKWPWRREPVPDESNNWQPRFYAGLAITAPGTSQVWSAQMDHAGVTAHGLLGEYFTDDRFRTRRFARVDPKLDFNWGFDSPGPGIGEDHFSIRWTGAIVPKSSDDYRFYFDADNEAQLWVNGEEIPQTTFKKVKKGQPDNGHALALKAGQKYPIKFEFKEGAGEASVTLGWGSATQKREVLESRQLSYEYDATSFEEDDRIAVTNATYAKGVWLRNGSYLAGEIVAADDSAAQVAWPDRLSPLTIPNTKIAHIVFRVPRRGLPLQLSENHTGLFVKNGDFLEAEFLGLKRGSLIVNSLLFGRRAFSLENNDAIALVFNNYSPAKQAFEIRLLNGSMFQAKSIRLHDGKLLVNDGALGEVPIAERDLFEIVNHTAELQQSSSH